MKFVVVAAVLYGIMGPLTYGAITALDQNECHRHLQATCDIDMVRSDQGIALMFSALPPGWLSVLFITDMYSYGLNYYPTPELRDRS
jgi:hypothetical protein